MLTCESWPVSGYTGVLPCNGIRNAAATDTGKNLLRMNVGGQAPPSNGLLTPRPEQLFHNASCEAGHSRWIRWFCAFFTAGIFPKLLVPRVIKCSRSLWGSGPSISNAGGC